MLFLWCEKCSLPDMCEAIRRADIKESERISHVHNYILCPHYISPSSTCSFKTHTDKFRNLKTNRIKQLGMLIIHSHAFSIWDRNIYGTVYIMSFTVVQKYKLAATEEHKWFRGDWELAQDLSGEFENVIGRNIECSVKCEFKTLYSSLQMFHRSIIWHGSSAVYKIIQI